MNISNKVTIDNDPYFNEVKPKQNVSFDLVLWLYRILKYWYLFVLGILIGVGVAYIKNKSWVPVFSTQSLVVLEERGTASVVNAVPLGGILRNTANQLILLRSYGMTQRTIERLPSRMYVNYFRQTNFKTLGLYADTPVRIDIIELTNDAYRDVFKVSPIDNNTCRISLHGEDDEKPSNFSIVATYGQEVVDPRFKIKLEKTPNYSSDYFPFSFSFLAQSQLIGMYHNRIVAHLLEEEGTAVVINMQGPDPYRDMDYMNAVLDEFQAYNLDLKNAQAELTIDFLTKQLTIISDSLKIARIALDKFQRESGVYEVTSKGLRPEIEDSDKERELLALRERSILLITQKIKEAILENTRLIVPADLGVADVQINAAVVQYNDILSSAQYLGAQSPLYGKTVDDLNKLRREILKELQIVQKKQQADKEALALKYRSLEARIDNLPLQERDLVMYERTYNVNEMYHQYLTQKRYEAEIQKASNTPDNYIWEKPRITSGPNNAGDKNREYVYWVFLGLLIPLCIVVLKEEVFNFTIASKEECEKLSGLPVIGTVENISNKLKNGMVLVKNYPKSSFAESFRNIRVRLEYMVKRESHFVVLVTSSEPADGKTFIATNIASVYQMMNKKIVIVDLDLRRPSVAKTLDIIGTYKGVSNFLIGQVSLDEIILSPSHLGFDVIPAGTLPPNPSELIKTDRTKELIDSLRERYDYVIVDCSPVGLVSDAYILSKLVDTTLFAVRRGKTNRSFFKSVVEQINNDRMSNVALVFNDVKGREGYYGTSRYYGEKSYYLKKNSYYHDDYFEK